MNSKLEVTGANEDVIERLEQALDFSFNGVFAESHAETVFVAYGEDAVDALRQSYAVRQSGSRATPQFGDVLLGQRESTLRSNRFPIGPVVSGKSDSFGFLTH